MSSRPDGPALNPAHDGAAPNGRRSFLSGLGVAAVALMTGGARAALPSGDRVVVAVFGNDGSALGARTVDRVVRSDAQWRATLSPAAYSVLRRDGTERAFSGRVPHGPGPGVYRCAGCGTALFDGRHAFDSGTGWPSFWRPIDPRNVVERTDRTLGFERTEVRCTRCDGHLGHVFDDGPRPTGLRYCMNSVALTPPSLKDEA